MVAINGAIPVGQMQSNNPIPEGIYHLRVQKIDFEYSAENKTPMLEMQLVVFGPSDAEEFVGRYVFTNLLLSGKGSFMARQFFEACGVGEDFVMDDTDKIPQFLNAEIAASVIEEPAKKDPRDPSGQKELPPRNNVKRIFAIE